jgi:tetratricopeptide (TPR) repeat protein
MIRWVLPVAVLLAVPALVAQNSSSSSSSSSPSSKKQQKELKKQRPPDAMSDKEEVPPEEDTSVAPQVFSFNPVQSQKEIQIGEFYYHKGSYRAAAGRFRDATKWNDGNKLAWLKLGEAEEKLKDFDAAKAAYAKFLALAPDGKDARDVKKKLAKLK